MHQNEMFDVQPEYHDHAITSVLFILEGRRRDVYKATIQMPSDVWVL